MKKFILSYFIILFFTFPVYSEVKVKTENFVQNDEKGRCLWAAVETAGLTNGWIQVKDWTKDHPNSISTKDMVERLDKQKITYRSFILENKEFYYFVRDSKNTTYKILENKKDADSLILAKGTGWYHTKYQHWDLNFIKQSIKRDVGAIVVVHYVKTLHAIYIIDITDEKVKFIDSNFPKGTIREEPLEWLMAKWTGIGLIIEKKP